MSASRTKKKRQRTHRYTSNVFSMFSQDQIQEFKEAFNMIDQNRDGFIDKDDLIEMLTSLGKNPDDIYVDSMVTEAPGPINFTMFLTLFGEKLNGTDPEDVIRNAFGCFDLKSLGFIPEDELREIMTTMGDRWEDSKVDELLNGAPIQNGLFDYIEFTRTLKHGAREKEGEQHPADPPASPSPVKPAPQMVFPPQKQLDKKPQPKQVENLKPKSSLKQSSHKQQQQPPQNQPPKPPQEQQQLPPKQQQQPPQEQAKPPGLKQPMKLDAVPKKSSMKPSPKGPKPSMSPGDSAGAPPLPKSAPPPQPTSPETNSSAGEGREMKTSPFGAVLKSTGKLPPYKKF